MSLPRFNPDLSAKFDEMSFVRVSLGFQRQPS